ncbi:VOC family protein [Streptomyces sp. NPDC085639]|uniref:VOC family protein n=1 Tax=Streptomyces sp. NPDC085639 TaxID=3365734 RepID=UPI0037CE39A7
MGGQPVTVSTSSHEAVGAPCWVSLTTPDLTSAQRFYGAVMGWTFRRTRLGEWFSYAFRDGAPVAGFVENPSLPAAWTPYFAVDDADVTAARIRERGATVAVGPLSFRRGRAVLAAAPTGRSSGSGRAESSGIGGWAAAPLPPGWNCAPAMPSPPPSNYGHVLDWAGESPTSCVPAHQ